MSAGLSYFTAHATAGDWLRLSWAYLLGALAALLAGVSAALGMA